MKKQSIEEGTLRAAMLVYSEPTWLAWANDWLAGNKSNSDAIVASQRANAEMLRIEESLARMRVSMRGLEKAAESIEKAMESVALLRAEKFKESNAAWKAAHAAWICSKCK